MVRYRERLEAIIKTEGEDSGSGSGGQYSRRQSALYLDPHAPPPAHVGTGRQGMLPRQSGLGPHVMDEKQ